MHSQGTTGDKGKPSLTQLNPGSQQEELGLLTEDVYRVGVAGIQDSRPGWGSEARRFPDLNPTEKARLQE